YDGVADALNNLGAICLERNELDQAERFYEQSYGLRENIANLEVVASSLNGLGIIVEQKGDLDLAEQFYHQSLTLREEIGTPEDIGISLNNLGEIHRQRGDLNKAEEFYLRCLKIDEEIGNPQEIATDLHNLALIHGRRGEFEKAKELHQRSFSLYQKVGNPREIAHSRYYLLQAYLQSGTLKQANDELEELAQAALTSEIPQARVYYHLAMGLMKQKQVDLSSALDFTSKAKAQAAQISHFELLVEASNLLIHIHLQMYLLLKQSEHKTLIENLLLELEQLCKRERLHGSYIETLLIQGFLKRAMFDLLGATQQFRLAELLAEERGFRPLAERARKQLKQLEEQTEILKRLMFLSPVAYEQVQLQEMASYLQDAKAHLRKEP
ncbi:MAG: tetratricopeptide repeat protein, partial [Candidatus Hodarchaeota archaeon]